MNGLKIVTYFKLKNIFEGKKCVKLKITIYNIIKERNPFKDKQNKNTIYSSIIFS